MMALPPTSASAAVGAAPVTKTIYFTVSGHNEQAEFSSDDTVEDVKGKVLFNFYITHTCCHSSRVTKDTQLWGSCAKICQNMVQFLLNY